jgi:nitrile hydratase subunit alpha
MSTDHPPAGGPVAAHHDDAAIARQVRELETLLESRSVVDGTELDAILDAFVGGASPANGARIIARAWVDPAYRQRLLDDGNAAVAELGYTAGGLQPQVLRVVANSEAVHNVIVCTLCSCYPIGLLGPSPSWYKSEAYRSRVVREPRAVLAEFGLELPAEVEIHVWDASAETRYMVLPRRPDGTEELDEAALAALVTRRGMIGTAAV